MAQTKKDASEELFGGSGLLDRLGKGKAMVETLAPEEAPKPQDIKASRRDSTKMPKRQISPKGEREKVRVSVYLALGDLDALDQQVIKNRKKTGRKKDRSALIREAVRFWLQTQE